MLATRRNQRFAVSPPGEIETSGVGRTVTGPVLPQTKLLPPRRRGSSDNGRYRPIVGKGGVNVQRSLEQKRDRGRCDTPVVDTFRMGRETTGRRSMDGRHAAESDPTSSIGSVPCCHSTGWRTSSFYDRLASFSACRRRRSADGGGCCKPTSTRAQRQEHMIVGYSAPPAAQVINACWCVSCHTDDAQYILCLIVCYSGGVFSYFACRFRICHRQFNRARMYFDLDFMQNPSCYSSCRYAFDAVESSQAVRH